MKLHNVIHCRGRRHSSCSLSRRSTPRRISIFTTSHLSTFYRPSFSLLAIAAALSLALSASTPASRAELPSDDLVFPPSSDFDCRKAEEDPPSPSGGVEDEEATTAEDAGVESRRERKGEAAEEASAELDFGGELGRGGADGVEYCPVMEGKEDRDGEDTPSELRPPEPEPEPDEVEARKFGKVKEELGVVLAERRKRLWTRAVSDWPLGGSADFTSQLGRPTELAA